MEIILPTRFLFLFANSIQVLVKCDKYYVLFINFKRFLYMWKYFCNIHLNSETPVGSQIGR